VSLDTSSWNVLDAAPDATIVVNQAGLIEFANRRTLDVLGWDPTELVGQAVEVLVPTSVRSTHHTHRIGYAEAPRPRLMGVGLELVAVHRDGHEVPVEVALNPLVSDDQRLVVASIRDITDRVRLAQQLNLTSSRLAVVDERDRIARDLHDNVIQRLFAAGLHLQAAVGRPDQDDRLIGVIDEIDEAIREIRTTIFTMHSPRGMHAGLEPAVRLVLAESSRVLGHQPSLHRHGVMALVPDPLAREAVDVVRELLTNVAKHAKATSSSVHLAVDNERLQVSVVDDGVGLVVDPEHPGQGLRNVVERAERHGGSASFEPGPDGGTVATWSVPIV
jgi:PAS domain S-box-containing protein